MSETRARHAAAPATRSKGRHRLPDTVEDPANIVPLTGPTRRVGERRAAMALERRLLQDANQHTTTQKAGAVAATTGLIMISSMSGAIAQASAQEEELEPVDTGSNRVVEDIDIITAPIVKVPQTRVQVKTRPAPPPPPPPAPVAVPAPVPVAGPRHAAPAASAPAPAPAPVVATPVPAPAYGSKGPTIAAAALGQLGRIQDCTMLVTNALAAVGIQFHDWPAGYFSLGSVVPPNQALPGDLIYYANGGAGVAHIAVYIGDNVAVHGGWNGNQTVTFSAYVGSGPVFIRVR